MYRALPSMKITILTFLEREAQWSAVYWNRDRRKVAEDSTKTENSNLLDTSVTEQRSEGRFTFLEKYAKYPNVIRVMLARDLRTKYPIRESELSQYLRIIDSMPQADRDVFLSWWDYIIKEREFKKKTRIILDSLIRVIHLVSSRLFQVIHHQRQ